VATLQRESLASSTCKVTYWSHVHSTSSCSGSAGDVSGGSIKLQQKRQEVPATDSSSIDPAEAAEAVEAAEPKELTPMDKSVAAASGFAGSKLGKITHFDMIAEAAAPAAPLLQE